MFKQAWLELVLSSNDFQMTFAFELWVSEDNFWRVSPPRIKTETNLDHICISGFRNLEYETIWQYGCLGMTIVNFSGNWKLIVYQFSISTFRILRDLATNFPDYLVLLLKPNIDNYAGFPVCCRPDPPPHHTDGRKRFPWSWQERIENLFYSCSEKNRSQNPQRWIYTYTYETM